MCQAVIGQVEDIARQHRAAAVTTVNARIGPLSGILQARKQIVATLVTGNHAAAAKNAQAIHDGFILDKNLTAQAARRRDSDLQQYFFGRMLEACRICHAQYATDKFPVLGGKIPAGHSH